MKNKGSTAIFTLMVAVVIIILALALSPIISQNVASARNTTSTDFIGLNCNNSSISDFDKASCTAVDLFTPTFLGILLAIAGAIAVGRLIISE